MEPTEEVENEDDFTDKSKAAGVFKSIKKRSFSYCEAPRISPSAPRRISVGPLQQPPPIPMRPLRPRVTSVDGSLDFDTIPKTEKLNNQIISTRPKVPYKPPSRNHLQKRTDDDRQDLEDDFYTISWKIELKKKKDSGVLPIYSSRPSESPSTIIEMDEPVPPVSTTVPVSIGDLEDVVMQLKNELDLLKTEMDSLKVLNEVVDSLKSDYERDIKILRQDLDKERTKVSDLQVELELLRCKTKGLQ